MRRLCRRWPTRLAFLEHCLCMLSLLVFSHYLVPASNMKVKVAERPPEADKLTALITQVKDQWFWIVINPYACFCLLYWRALSLFYGGNIVNAIFSNKSFTLADQLKLTAVMISVGPLGGVARWLVFDMAARTSHGMENIIDKKEEKVVESLFTYYLFGGLKYTANTLFAFTWMSTFRHS